MITRQHAIFPTSNHAPIRNLLIVLANISFLILNKGRKEGYYTIRKDKWKLRLLSNETYTQKKKHARIRRNRNIRKEMFGSIHEPVSFVATCNERRATKHIARVSSRRLNLLLSSPPFKSESE